VSSGDVSDAAWNAVAVASIAHREAVDSGDNEAVQRERGTFAHILTCAQTKGLNITDLCHASGLDAPFINELLAEPEPEQRAS